jgi:hypothetical protein
MVDPQLRRQKMSVACENPIAGPAICALGPLIENWLSGIEWNSDRLGLCFGLSFVPLKKAVNGF